MRRGMLSRIKLFYFFTEEAPTTHGCPRIYGGTGPDTPFEAQVSHHTYAELMQKLGAFMPRGRLKDVWQIAHGEPVYFTESNYHGVRRDAPLTALFVV